MVRYAFRLALRGRRRATTAYAAESEVHRLCPSAERNAGRAGGRSEYRIAFEARMQVICRPRPRAYATKMNLASFHNNWSIKWSILLGPLVLLASLVCLTPAQHPTPKKEDVSPSVNDAYRIRSGDKLSVKFLYQPDLNELSVVVRPDGFINLSMIDEVMARGLTVAELKAGLEKAYSEILLKPVIS